MCSFIKITLKYFSASQMGADNLTLAEGDHSLFSAGLWGLHRRYVALVSGAGRGGSLDSLQLSCEIILLAAALLKL